MTFRLTCMHTCMSTAAQALRPAVWVHVQEPALHMHVKCPYKYQRIPTCTQTRKIRDGKRERERKGYTRGQGGLFMAKKACSQTSRRSRPVGSMQASSWHGSSSRTRVAMQCSPPAAQSEHAPDIPNCTGEASNPAVFWKPGHVQVQAPAFKRQRIRACDVGQHRTTTAQSGMVSAAKLMTPSKQARQASRLKVDATCPGKKKSMHSMSCKAECNAPIPFPALFPMCILHAIGLVYVGRL